MIHANQLIKNENGKPSYLMGGGDEGIIRIDVRLGEGGKCWVATRAVESWIEPETEETFDKEVPISYAVRNLASPVRSKIQNEKNFSVAAYIGGTVRLIRPLVWVEGDKVCSLSIVSK